MATSANSPSWLSPRELAEFLDIPVGTIYGWRHTGFGPPAYKYGRHVKYRLADVERWLESRAERQTPGR